MQVPGSSAARRSDVRIAPICPAALPNLPAHIAAGTTASPALRPLSQCTCVASCAGVYSAAVRHGLMSRLSKAKGRRESGTFVAIPDKVVRHEKFAALSPIATKLLCDCLAQYNRINNGDLCVTFKVMQRRGWRSKQTLARALAELERTGFLIRTRQGGRNRCSLFALSFFAIDDCKGKHDLQPTAAPPGDWKQCDEN